MNRDVRRAHDHAAWILPRDRTNLTITHTVSPLIHAAAHTAATREDTRYGPT
jgi:hypothetical protein